MSGHIHVWTLKINVFILDISLKNISVLRHLFFCNILHVTDHRPTDLGYFIWYFFTPDFISADYSIWVSKTTLWNTLII